MLHRPQLSGMQTLVFPSPAEEIIQRARGNLTHASRENADPGAMGFYTNICFWFRQCPRTIFPAVFKFCRAVPPKNHKRLEKELLDMIHTCDMERVLEDMRLMVRIVDDRARLNTITYELFDLEKTVPRGLVELIQLDECIREVNQQCHANMLRVGKSLLLGMIASAMASQTSGFTAMNEEGFKRMLCHVYDRIPLRVFMNVSTSCLGRFYQELTRPTPTMNDEFYGLHIRFQYEKTEDLDNIRFERIDVFLCETTTGATMLMGKMDVIS